jgi:hypothetical protein
VCRAYKEQAASLREALAAHTLASYPSLDAAPEWRAQLDLGPTPHPIPAPVPHPPVTPSSSLNCVRPRSMHVWG